MTVYKKMVQAYKKDYCWNEYEDGHLKVKISYVNNHAIFSVWGADDFGMELTSKVESDAKMNKLLKSWLSIYHDMPKYVSVDWLKDRGFTYA